MSDFNDWLAYDPDTGVFTWKANRGTAKKGDIAGCINKKGYRRIQVGKRGYPAHRLAWLYTHEVWPKRQIDHINGVKDDNRISNLRDVSPLENKRNQRNIITNKTGILGVRTVKDRPGQWRAQISVHQKNIHLYYGSDFLEACSHRKSAEIRYGFHANHGR